MTQLSLFFLSLYLIHLPLLSLPARSMAAFVSDSTRGSADSELTSESLKCSVTPRTKEANWIFSPEKIPFPLPLLVLSWPYAWSRHRKWAVITSTQAEGAHINTHFLSDSLSFFLLWNVFALGPPAFGDIFVYSVTFSCLVPPLDVIGNSERLIFVIETYLPCPMDCLPYHQGLFHMAIWDRERGEHHHLYTGSSSHILKWVLEYLEVFFFFF